MLKDGRYRVQFHSASKRSLPQNAYYWGVVCQIVLDCLREAGYNEIKSIEDAHEILKYKFLREQIISEHGEVIELLGSTSKLSKEKFGIYIEEIAQWVAESFQVVIPAPGQQTQLYQ